VCILLFRKYSPIAQPEYGAHSNKVKLPKVGSNAIVPVPVGAGPKQKNEKQRQLWVHLWLHFHALNFLETLKRV